MFFTLALFFSDLAAASKQKKLLFSIDKFREIKIMTNNGKEEEPQFLVRWYSGGKSIVYSQTELHALRKKSTGGNGTYIHHKPLTTVVAEESLNVT